jgi:hypothetical protein
MEKNMQGIRPRSLSNTELINYCAIHLELADDRTKDGQPLSNGMPLEWQTELLRRYIALAPVETPMIPQNGQLDLFK